MSDSCFKPLSSIVSLVVDKCSSNKDLTKPYIGLEHIPSNGSILQGSAEANDSVSINNIFRSGDILFGKLRPRLRKSVRAPFDGYCSTDILVLRPRQEVCPDFAGFVLQSNAVFIEAIRTEEGTKMPRCSWHTLQELEVFCPNLTKQRNIARILSSIDRAIAHTEALIDKYQQIKAGLMHDLFTRGIGADGKLRSPREEAPELYQESAIGWIPRDWSVTEVISCGSVKLGRQRSPDKHSGKWTVPYLRVANVFDGFFDFEDVLEMDFTPEEREIFSVKSGDIFLNEGQSLELVGRCALYIGEDNKYCFQNTLVRFRCYEEHIPYFYRQLFKYYLDIGKFMDIASQTTSVAHLGADRFAKLKIPQLPSTEQKILADKLSLIDLKIDAERDSLKKLLRQKSGLMHDLLTGKVPVNVNADEGAQG